MKGGAKKRPGLRRTVSPRRRLVTPEDVYPVEPWRLVERRFFPRFLPQTETFFATSNGYLGIRGTFEEGVPAEEPGTFLNGFYETWPIVYGEDAYGFAKTGQTMLHVPDGTRIKLYVDDEPFVLSKAHLISFERALDMRAGTLDREVHFETPDGKRVAVRSRRLVSLEQRHLACIVYEVQMLRGRAQFTISSELVTPEAPAESRNGDPRRRSLDGRVLVPTDHRAHDHRVLLNLETRSSGLRMACAMDHRLETECPAEVEEADSIEDRGRVVFLVQAAQGAPVRLVKFLAYHHSATADAGELRFRTNRTLEHALSEGVDRVLEAQRQRLDAFWEHSDVEIDGDPEVQQAIRYNLFQIHQATARVDGFGVPAKGLTGIGYEGHYFWDTEIYVLPFLVYTEPRIARSLLGHRYTQLERARLRAREVGQRGALFPWRTISGEEASAYYAAGTAQYHINADIAFAASRYVSVSGDLQFLARGMAEIGVETARLWLDLGFYSERKAGAFCINGVTGPDEYNTVVNNNAFTNLMARENLESAVRAVEFLQSRAPEELARLVESTGLDLSELEEWRRAAEHMYLPYDEKAGVHLQDDAFLDRELWDFEHTPPERYPLLLHYHPLVIYRHQVIKQADVVLATFLLGEHFTPEEKKRIFDYYDPLTTGDSSLSVCIQSIMASEVGYREKAYRYFADALVMDLGDIGGNVRDGLHVAALGGTWMALIFGFGGLRDHGGVLRFRPQLPEGWTRLRFRLAFRGHRLEVELRPDRAEYRLLHGRQLQIEHEGEEVRLRRDELVSRPITPGKAEPEA